MRLSLALVILVAASSAAHSAPGNMPGPSDLVPIGINFKQSFTDRLRMGIQMSTSQIGSEGDFRMQADWYYLDHRFPDWLGLRAGRTKMPFGLYNEVNDIDAARVPVLLPRPSAT
jgi:hypothetical protein